MHLIAAFELRVVQLCTLCVAVMSPSEAAPEDIIDIEFSDDEEEEWQEESEEYDTDISNPSLRSDWNRLTAAERRLELEAYNKARKSRNNTKRRNEVNHQLSHEIIDWSLKPRIIIDCCQ